VAARVLHENSTRSDVALEQHDKERDDPDDHDDPAERLRKHGDEKTHPADDNRESDEEGFHAQEMLQVARRMITITGGNVRTFLLVFDKGDDVLATLRRFADEHAIRGGFFTALGAFRSATIAYWNAETKEYERIEVAEQVEVISMTGDVAVSNGETKLHAHVTLGRRGGATIGGHLLGGIVYPTLEMHVTDFGTDIVRSTDAETGLPLISR